MTNPVLPAAAPVREFPPLLVLTTLAIGFVMAMIDVTAVNTALTDIAASLAVPLAGLVWVVDGYTLTFAALLMAGGALADRFGPKNIYQSGLAVFILGSGLCALAPSGPALVAARLLQGVGAALFMPSSLSLLMHAYDDPATRTRMLATWSAIVACSSAAGPLVGGMLVHQCGWRSVFWVNLPIGLAGIVLAQMVVPPTAANRRPLSLGSHALGVVMLAGLSFVLIEGPVLGWSAFPVLAALVATVTAGALLVRRERWGHQTVGRQKMSCQSGAEPNRLQPLIAPALFATPTFAAANGVGFMINFAVYGQLFLLSLYLQEGGADALETGIRLIPMMAAFAVGNLTSGRISARTGPRAPMLVGLLVGVLAALLMLATIALYTQHTPHTPYTPHAPYWLLTAAIMVMNVAIGIAIPAMTATVMLVAGREYANSAAAALNTNRQVGALVGVAAMGAVLHMAPSWAVRLPWAFGLVAAAYASAAYLVHRYIR